MDTSNLKQDERNDVKISATNEPKTESKETINAKDILDQIVEPRDRNKEPSVKKIEAFGSQAREMTG